MPVPGRACIVASVLSGVAIGPQCPFHSPRTCLRRKCFSSNTGLRVSSNLVPFSQRVEGCLPSHYRCSKRLLGCVTVLQPGLQMSRGCQFPEGWVILVPFASLAHSTCQTRTEMSWTEEAWSDHVLKFRRRKLDPSNADSNLFGWWSILCHYQVSPLNAGI